MKSFSLESISSSRSDGCDAFRDDFSTVAHRDLPDIFLSTKKHIKVHATNFQPVL